MDKITLFCLPYAGGSAAVFSSWGRYVASEIKLVPIELAGRGKRIHDALYPDLPAMVEDVFTMVRKEATQSPYAIFGHSMGALVSYALTHKLIENNLPPPLHIFFSGRGAPHVRQPDEKKCHLLNEHDFREQVMKLGGTPPEFFQHPELMELFLPLLRNDFKIAESDFYAGVIKPLDINITVFEGKDDDLTAEECDGWKKHTRQLCSMHYFEGGHFFLHQEKEQIVRFINHTLLTNVFVKFKELQFIV
jgi:medium-chain acyl-[acyl-carrier-protein] hydrolase